MISIKNWTEITGIKVESNLNIVEWTWDNTNWTRFNVKDDFGTKIEQNLFYGINIKYFDQGYKNYFDQKSNWNNGI